MLKLLSLQKKRTATQAKLKDLRAKRAKLRADEEALKEEIDRLEEITPDLEAQIDALTEEQNKTEDAINEALDAIEKIDEEIAGLSEEIADEAEEDPPVRSSKAPRLTRTAPASGSFQSRSRCFKSRAERDAFYGQSEVKSFLERLRTLGGSGRRAATGAELNIPVVMLDLIRDNLGQYSKLISYVRLRPVRGQARQNVTGEIPEGIWTEMAGILNELEFAFTQIELDGYKVGGYIPVDNYVLKDSDINLGEEIMSMLLAAIGLALDKAIIYGTGSKMPVGIVTRLAQTSQPAYWGSNQGTWTDLHSSHVIQLNIAGSTGTAFFQPLLAALGKAEPKRSAGRTFWAMNHETHMDLIGRGLAFDSAGALVAGFRDSMPAEFGDIVELEFIPAKEIVGGFGDLYILAEREGGTVSQSEHARFIEDQTVFKGVARYDGQPVRGEAFVVVNYNNQSPTTTASFSPDYANQAMNTLVCVAAAGTALGDTVVTVSGAIAGTPDLAYSVSTALSIKVGDKLPASGWADLTSGTTQITAAAGVPITVVELDGDDRVVSLGYCISVPKAS